MSKLDFGQPFSVAATGTAIATATKTGATGAIFYITDISASSVAAQGTFAVYGFGGTSQGTTVLWQGQLGTVPYIHSWISPIPAGLGGTLQAIANGTTNTYVNISGIQINAQ